MTNGQMIWRDKQSMPHANAMISQSLSANKPMPISILNIFELPYLAVSH